MLLFCSSLSAAAVAVSHSRPRYSRGMEIVKNVFVVLHILSFAVVFGATLAQLSNLKTNTAQVTKGILHGALGLLVTGLVLVGMLYAIDVQPNNAKIGAKTLVLLLLIALIIVNRKKKPVSGGVLGGILALSTLNVFFAVLW